MVLLAAQGLANDEIARRQAEIYFSPLGSSTALALASSALSRDSGTESLTKGRPRLLSLSLRPPRRQDVQDGHIRVGQEGHDGAKARILEREARPGHSPGLRRGRARSEPGCSPAVCTWGSAGSSSAFPRATSGASGT